MSHRLILEIEVPDFNVDGVEEMLSQLSADGFNVSLFVTLEECMNDDFEVHAMKGRIVGARIVEVEP